MTAELGFVLVVIFASTVYVLRVMEGRIKDAISSVETAVHDRANHLVLDALADAKKAEVALLNLNAAIGRHVSAEAGRVAEATKNHAEIILDHVTTETTKIKDEVVTHAKGALAAVANGVRHAFCATCNRLSHTWHVIEGKVECKDCEIRRTTN